MAGRLAMKSVPMSGDAAGKSACATLAERAEVRPVGRFHRVDFCSFRGAVIFDIRILTGNYKVALGRHEANMWRPVALDVIAGQPAVMILLCV